MAKKKTKKKQVAGNKDVRGELGNFAHTTMILHKPLLEIIDKLAMRVPYTRSRIMATLVEAALYSLTLVKDEERQNTICWSDIKTLVEKNKIVLDNILLRKREAERRTALLAAQQAERAEQEKTIVQEIKDIWNV